MSYWSNDLSLNLKKKLIMKYCCDFERILKDILWSTAMRNLGVVIYAAKHLGNFSSENNTIQQKKTF